MVGIRSPAVEKSMPRKRLSNIGLSQFAVINSIFSLIALHIDFSIIRLILYGKRNEMLKAQSRLRKIVSVQAYPLFSTEI